MFIEYLIYLFYGLAFIILGVAVFAKDKRFSKLKIAGILWLLGLFGLIHGVHEWMDLYRLFGFHEGDDIIFNPAFRLAVMSVSFLVLLVYGIRLNLIVSSKLNKTSHALKYIAAGSVGTLLVTSAVFYFNWDTENSAAMFVRCFLGFPSALLSGIGMIGYSRAVRHMSAEGAGSFAASGAAMIAYAFFTGLFPSETLIPALNIKIVAVRGVCAIVILHFMMKALTVFDIEYMNMLETRLQRLAQSEKLSSIGKLAAGIAHEINNPLANASLGIEIIKDRISDDMVMAKLESVEKSIDRASKIAGELLLYAREKEAEFVSFNVSELLDSIKTLISHSPAGRLVVYGDIEDAKISGIIWKLEEVLINLIMNSCEATEGDGEILISSSFSNGFSYITVEDRGTGIPPEYLSRIFDPFFTTKDVGEGTGMGLSICYNIVKMHGGDISIENRMSGGVRAVVSIPAERADG
ncbi:sensor histidine kinase [Seleniivibrio woodruffii]|uniref:sensor histidine kinase n=1 Tax=Seleniivibrio woodruffii TaxID=1078050 RepID=UPI002409D902|nr:HAMP domain-containing sensor histidine kinase [Seleniivibrio woodruffii]